MSGGFEVRSLSVDRNVLKRLKKEEDEEIFTIQVGDVIVHCTVHNMEIENIQLKWFYTECSNI